MLIYIHGFNSSALSLKAGLVRKRMVELGRGNEFFCPELPDRPRNAVALLDDLVRDSTAASPALIGSSLGGYYATWLAERHHLRAVLVNPAVRPYELLGPALGMQTNLYTGVRYELTADHLEELRELEVATVRPERYLLLVSTGDEVLDYRRAVEKYRGSEKIIHEGGDHGFSDFERHLGRVLAFCGVGS
jgi:predicted esterase YcpF (UPF0227 family)